MHAAPLTVPKGRAFRQVLAGLSAQGLPRQQSRSGQDGLWQPFVAVCWTPFHTAVQLIVSCSFFQTSLSSGETYAPFLKGFLPTYHGGLCDLEP